MLCLYYPYSDCLEKYFLLYSQLRGNDLSNHLKDGSKWFGVSCLCNLQEPESIEKDTHKHNDQVKEWLMLNDITEIFSYIDKFRSLLLKKKCLVNDGEHILTPVKQLDRITSRLQIPFTLS